MCEEICEIVENVESGRVFVVEDGGIWFSGMNSRVGDLVEEVAHELSKAGYETGIVQGDGSEAFGGLFLPVPDACSVDDDIHESLVSHPGGSRRRVRPQ